jgi:non-ribosomal peptide synthetase component E (peptide arylation enzyme)
VDPTPSAGTFLRRTDRDREAFTAEGFYHSGDLVRALWYEGSLSYSSEGRIYALIDRGGEKVNAEEVELLVAGHPAVAEMALVGMPDPDWTSAAAPMSCPGPAESADASRYLRADLELRAWPSTSGPNVSN